MRRSPRLSRAAVSAAVLGASRSAMPFYADFTVTRVTTITAVHESIDGRQLGIGRRECRRRIDAFTGKTPPRR